MVKPKPNLVNKIPSQTNDLAKVHSLDQIVDIKLDFSRIEAEVQNQILSFGFVEAIKEY